MRRSGLRAKVPMRRKLAGNTFSNSLEFGARDGRLVAPSGLISTQNVDLTIQYLVARSRGIRDFDRLPIPFRAVATDMQNGDMVVLREGDLALSMRASMAVPGAFAPVTIDGRILGDGGLTRNVPVDIARQTCADVVIAVAVPNPVPTAAELRSPLTLMSRTLDVLISANERQQLETLGPDDVKIIIEMGDIGSASFDRVPDAIPLGRAAALAHRTELERYSLPEAEFLAWRSATSRVGREPMRLAAVNVVGAERANPEFVAQTFGLQAGDVVDNRKIGDRATAVFALSDFERVAYTLAGDERRAGAEPASDGEVLGTEHRALRPRVPHRHGCEHSVHDRWRLICAPGSTTAAAKSTARGGSAARPASKLQCTSHWTPSTAGSSSPARWRSARSRTSSSTATRWRATGSPTRGRYLEAGRVFGNRAELRAGIRGGGQTVDREIGTPDLPEISGEGYGGLSMRYTYDTRDRDVLWQDGSLVRMTYFRGEESLGAVDQYDRLEGMAMAVVPFSRNVLYLRASGGASFGSDLPIYDTFTLGGPVSMPGLNVGELRGTSYWAAQASYLQRIADISYVFGQSLYAGFTASAADMSGRIDDVRAEPILLRSVRAGGPHAARSRVAVPRNYQR